VEFEEEYLDRVQQTGPVPETYTVWMRAVAAAPPALNRYITVNGTQVPILGLGATSWTSVGSLSALPGQALADIIVSTEGMGVGTVLGSRGRIRGLRWGSSSTVGPSGGSGVSQIRFHTYAADPPVPLPLEDTVVGSSGSQIYAPPGFPASGANEGKFAMEIIPSGTTAPASPAVPDNNIYIAANTTWST